MRYDLPLSQEKFIQADRIVRAVLLHSGRVDVYSPDLVTCEEEDFSESEKKYIRENPGSLGVCFKNHKVDTFDIWISPAFKSDSNAYKDTILHELCHGYLGAYKHGHRWLRFFGRVLYAYDTIVEPISRETQLPNALLRYMKQHSDEGYGKYMDRIDTEQTSIEKIAINELPDVTNMYDRLTRRETNV